MSIGPLSFPFNDTGHKLFGGAKDTAANSSLSILENEKKLQSISV
jgi:hypothetical protein